MNASNVIFMEERTSESPWRAITVRDRRYSIRYPFAADVELIDMQSGASTTGVSSDISMGGLFVCASKPFPLATRARLTLTRKNQVVHALVVVRIVKPRIGMGIEFLDVEAPSDQVLFRWIEQLRRK
ncbi:MAG: PilZ domain-containing protein [Acidobacteriota bacterium]|nr:PilZ domain-containing protein [Acidobacteriota bacterium]